MDFNSSTVYGAIAGGAAVTLLWTALGKARNKLPYPPGPKGLPLLGNILDIPFQHPWLTYDAWGKKYGDVAFLEAAGQRIIILTSAQAATDLLEQRSTICSGRPRAVVLNELMELGWSFAFLPYGDDWRMNRRDFHQATQPEAIRKWASLENEEAHAFLGKLLKDPSKFIAHTRSTLGDILVRIVYGLGMHEDKDSYIEPSERVLAYIGEATLPGAFMADVIPALKYVPSWVPGAGFQKKAADCRHQSDLMLNRPFAVVKDSMTTGDLRDCVGRDLLLKPIPDGMTSEKYDVYVKNLCGVFYGAGSDTSVSSITSFFLAMAMYPDVRKKAQAELDAVIGSDRLPDLSDRASLPYVNALILETLRWQPVTPLGVPHSTDEDIEYKGFFIPKGTVVIASSWSILHNPKDYPEPEVFKPERFLRASATGALELDPNVRDPRTAAFGFGRRICPGRHLAEQIMFAVIASVLYAFDISPVAGEKLEAQVTSGIVSYPVPFKCDIKPRSARAEQLIRDSELTMCNS